MSLKLTLRELEVLVAVADAGSVTQAASQLAMTQSAASQALATLETQLSVQLFDRIGRKLILNEHGRLLLPNARAMLDTARAAEQLFQGTAALRLGASTTIANYLLPQALARFLHSYPTAKIELQVANTSDIVSSVASFAVDVGFIEGPCHHPDLHVTPWITDELVVFVGYHHPLAHKKLALADLADAPWILRESGSGTRSEVERLLLPQIGALPVSMEIGNSEAIKHLVAAGLGISCLSRKVIADQLAQGSVVAVSAPLAPLQRTLYRITHKDKIGTKALSNLVEAMAGITAEPEPRRKELALA